MADRIVAQVWASKFLELINNPINIELHNRFNKVQKLYDLNFTEGSHNKFDFEVSQMCITDNLREVGLLRHHNDSYLERRGGFNVKLVDGLRVKTHWFPIGDTKPVKSTQGDLFSFLGTVTNCYPSSTISVIPDYAKTKRGFIVDSKDESILKHHYHSSRVSYVSSRVLKKDIPLAIKVQVEMFKRWVGKRSFDHRLARSKFGMIGCVFMQRTSKFNYELSWKYTLIGTKVGDVHDQETPSYEDEIMTWRNYYHTHQIVWVE